MKKSAVIVALTLFAAPLFTSAGSLTPPGSPADTMYTMTNLYDLAAGTTATLGSGTIPATPGSVAATFYTLTQIYTAIAGEIANLANGKIASGISAFGFTGTLFGDTSAAKVLTTATYPGTYDASNLSVGTVLSGTAFGVGLTGTVIQSLGNAVAGNVLSGTTFSNASAANVSGTIPVKTADNAVTTTSVSGTSLLLTPLVGYYDGTATVSTTSAAFIAGNIRSGVNLFGIAGSLAAYTYGGNDAATVLTTASSAGTYDASNLTVSTVKSGTTFGVSSTGSLTPDGGTAAVGDLFNGKTANLTGDWTLDTGTLDLACNTATFDGSGNLVAGAYDGAGSGSNRWCITDSGDAVAGDMLSGKIAWVDGLAVTGTMPTQTLSAANDTVSAGYYAATTLSAVDTDLAAGNIASGVTVFGIAGSHASGFTYGAQPLKTGQTICYDASGGVIACSGTGQDGAYTAGVTRSYTDPADGTITDNATGLMWEKCSEGLSGASCGTGTATTYTWTNALAQCEGSTANSHSDWRLPNRLELETLVDSSASSPAINATYFPAAQSDFYWSSTSYKPSLSNAWVVNFYNGSVDNGGKANSNYVRCVRG